MSKKSKDRLKIDEYVVVFGADIIQLEARVREKLQQGFEPKGALAVNGQGHLYQPMVSYLDPNISAWG